MKRIILLFLLFFIETSQAASISANQLYKSAECIAAVTLVTTSFELEKDYKNVKFFSDLSNKLWENYVSDLTDYAYGDDSKYHQLLSLPSQILNKYSSLEPRAQTQYAIQVVGEEKCAELSYSR